MGITSRYWLLDALGSETRRRILNLISHESMYFNQLAKEIRTESTGYFAPCEDTGFD